MGIYLNPSNINFKETISADIYVDKTLMLADMNRFIDKGNKYICMSRPRRFGKTIAGNMLAAYYSKGCDSKDLFTSFKIGGEASFTEKINKYNVIQLDMNSEYQNTMDRENLIDSITGKVKAEMRIEFPVVKISESDTIAEAILKIFVSTGETFVIIMDEYDVLVREHVSESLFNNYLSFLNGLFKSNTVRQAISLAYITGILPVVRDKVQSKLNNFREYSFINAGLLTQYVGFTGDETKMLCEENGMDFKECKKWYDGYFQNGVEIYNPESVILSIENRRFGNYWSQTSSYEVIADRIAQNFEGTKDAVVRMLAGESIKVNVTSYLNTMDSFKTKDDLFTYLIHVGYLTYDLDEGTCRIPNREIRQEWFNAIATNSDYEITDRIIKASEELLSETLAGNEEAVAKALDDSHINVTSNRSYNNEDVLQSAIYLAYIYALNKYTIIKEMTAGKGFADVVFIPYKPGIPAIIIELKRNKTTESALDQIKEKKYFSSMDHYSGNLLFVGINYDEGTKKHECKIERFAK